MWCFNCCSGSKGGRAGCGRLGMQDEVRRVLQPLGKRAEEVLPELESSESLMSAFSGSGRALRVADGSDAGYSVLCRLPNKRLGQK